MKNSNILLTIIFISCLATGGIFVRLSEIPPITTGFFRVLFSIPILYPLLVLDKRKNILSIKDKIFLFFAGMFLGGDLILWNISFFYTTVANANLLANLVPFTIIPASYFLYKEKISLRFFLGLIITLVGLFILVSGKNSLNERNILGDLLAFLTSIFYATFLLIVYKVRNNASSIQVMYYSAYGSIVVLLIASIFIEKLPFPQDFNAILPILGLTVLSQILGQGGLSYVLGKISANLASLLVLLQPVISAVYAYFIFEEMLSLQEVLGVLIVLWGIFFAKIK